MASSTRVLTAVALLPLAYVLVFLLPPGGFAIAAALLLMIGSWEFRRLAALGRRPAGWLLVELQAVIFVLLAIYWPDWTADPLAVFQLACLGWLIMFLQLRLHVPSARPGRTYSIRGFLNGLGVITFGWMALAWLRFEPNGEWWLLLLLLTIWASDIGAYFTGRAFGHRKMAPAISPGKTWAGFWGGLGLATAMPVAAVALIPQLQAPWPWLVVLGLVTAAASVGGDLLISLHKRTVGRKDSGNLLPGHGGILDRLDSLLAGAPFFVLGKLLAGL